MSNGITTPNQLQQWLLEEWISGLSQSIESMTGEKPEMGLGSVPFEVGESETLIWSETLSLGLDHTLVAVFPRQSWESAGRVALAAIGLEEADDASIRGTFLEMARQAIAVAARSIGARLGREVNPASAGELNELPFPVFQVEGTCGGQSITHGFGFSDAVLSALASKPSTSPKSMAAAAGAGTSMADENPASVESTTHSFSRTLDLILDVELPVSVSFGRARVPLKEVLKLTSGSIVELNRTVSEPVEVIVNNCVIARGEVVVVEGNYGIRINQIVSREERLRTLN
jgi:flagellar motor switch protein FliN/FliY